MDDTLRSLKTAPGAGLVPPAKWNALIDHLGRTMITQAGGLASVVRQGTPTVWVSPIQTAARKLPLELYAASATEVSVWPGAVTSGAMSGYFGNPTLNGDELSLLPTDEPVDDATTEYWLKVTTSDLDVIAVIVEAYTDPVDDGTDFYLPLGSVVMASGAITAVYPSRTTSLVFQKCASGVAVWGPA